MNFPFPLFKEISFSEYERAFMTALRSPDDTTTIFYKIQEDGVQISFSWDNFIIITFASFDLINKIYQDQNINTIDVATDDTGVHPYFVKFQNDYMFQRGIREK